MSYTSWLRGTAALLSLAAMSAPRTAVSSTFSDVLVQPPALQPPERGSVAGAFAHLAFEPGGLARGDFSVALPIALPGERGAPLVNLLPGYSPGGGQSEWGMGWRIDLGIRRFAIAGDIDMAGDEFVSPWGRLARGDDGRYLPLGAAPQVSLRRVNGGWAATTSDGTVYTFAATDVVAGGYAWMLSRVDDVLGGATVLSYQRNASGRPFVSSVEWGGRGSQRQYRMELGYESIAATLEDYRSGSLLALDRRVHDVTLAVRSVAGTFDRRWSYRLDYAPGATGAAFYLTGVTRTFGSGAVEPAQHFDYDLGGATIAAAALVDAPALSTALASVGAGALQPDKAGAVDLEDDGLVDFEVARDQTLVHRQAGGFAIEALPANPASLALCRPPVQSVNQPRTLARMTPDAALQVFRSINNVAAGTTRMLVCDRQGVPVSDQTIAGAWALGPTVHLVDLNHDHRPDLVRLFSHGYQVVENTSDATGIHYTVHPTEPLDDAFTPDSSWVQDMNGDGQPDLVMRSSSSLAVWFGLGQFHFSPALRSLVLKTVTGTTVTDLAQRQLTFIDVNRDGLMDVIATRGRTVNLFVNDGHQLSEVVVPGLQGISWDFGAPVVADVTGSGEYEVVFANGTQGRAIRLTSPSTGLLIATHDGKGTDVQLGYRRSAPSAGFGPRMTLLDSLTVASSGYDAVTYRYDYGAPVIHSLGKHLVGFASVDRQAPVLHQHVEFLNDDDASGVHALSETIDDRSPGIVQFALDRYDDVTFNGVRWLRPSLTETGHRTSDASTVLSTTKQYAVYERGFCPTVVIASSPGGQLTTTTTLASVAAISDELHCLAGSQMLVGTHTDPSLDFTYLASIRRNSAGQVEQVTQIDPHGPTLVLQDVAYDASQRIASIGAPGRGTTTVRHDDLGRLDSITDPAGVITQVGALDPLSDAPLELQTVRPGAPMSAFFDYDGRERLKAAWNDSSGGSAEQPATGYAYVDATTTTPARIDTRSLVDATGTSRHAVALLAADGAALVDGRWLGDHFALDTAAIEDRATLTHRSSFIGAVGGDALAAITSADLRASGTQLVEDVRAGFGHSTRVTTTQQTDVTGTATTELALSGGELITRVHQPGGTTAESAVDAAGRLVRKTDENGVIHRYTYDAIGRLVALDTPDGSHRLTLDGFGRPARIARDGIGAIAYAYDPTSGLLAHKQRLDRTGALVDTIDTRYDPIGRPIQRTQTVAGSNDATELAFDHDGQLDGATVPGQLGRQTRVRGDGWARSALFDPLGRVYREHTVLAGWRDITDDRTYRVDGSVASDSVTIADANGAVVLTSTRQTMLDDLGRVHQMAVDGAVLYTLSYDFEGRVARADFASGESLTFEYDAATHRGNGYQLSAPEVSGGVHWSLDPRGLVKTETLSTGAGDAHRDYTYDGRGQLTRAVTGNDTATYSYTASGLPDTIDDAAGARSAGRASSRLTAGATSHAWDTAGRAIGKGEWSLEYGPDDQIRRARRPGRQIEFVYDEADRRLLKRVDGAPVRAEVANGVLTEDHFIELVTIGGVVAGVLDNGRFTALLTDPRGTPFAGTDGTPGIASPYGVRSSHFDYSEVIDYARLGWDPDLDLVRMGVRDYDAGLGQFLTPDPLYLQDLDRCQASPLQCSLYGYAQGSPTNFTDPSGLDDATSTPPAPLAADTYGRLPISNSQAQGPYAYLYVTPAAANSGGVQIGGGLVNGPLGPGVSAQAVQVEAGAGRFVDASGTKNYGADANANLTKLTMQGGPFTVDGGVLNADVGGFANRSDASVGAQLNVIDGALTIGSSHDSVRFGLSVGVGGAARVHYGDTDGNGLRELGFGFDAGIFEFDCKTEVPSKVVDSMERMASDGTAGLNAVMRRGIPF